MENNIARLSLYRIISIIFVLYLINAINQNVVASLNQISNDSLEITGRESFEISEIKIKGDTLSFVSGSDSLWYPFGIFKDVESFIKAHKKATAQRCEYYKPTDTTTIIENDLFEVKSGRSNLILRIDLDNFEGLRILSGKIFDNSLDFKYSIHIGMSQRKFMKIFFTNVPEKLINSVRNVEMISIIYGMWHYYTFKNDKLKKVEFESHTSLRIKN